MRFRNVLLLAFAFGLGWLGAPALRDAAASGFGGGAGVTWPLTATGTAATNYITSPDGSSAPVSGAAAGSIRYNNTAGSWQVSTQAGAWANLATSAGSTLQSAYAAGPGITETSALGAVTLTAPLNAFVNGLSIVQGNTTKLGLLVTGGSISCVGSGGSSERFGLSARAAGLGGSAFGNGSQATGSNCSAFGINSAATGTSSSAYGSTTTASGTSGSVFGTGSSDGGFSNATVLGAALTATAADQTMIGGFLYLGGATANDFIESPDGSTAAVSAAATGRLRYNNSTGTWQVSTQGGAWASLTTGGASTLQLAYNGGVSITETSALGPVAITAPVNAFVNGLTITESNTGQTALVITSQGSGISCVGTGANSQRFGINATAAGANSTAVGDSASAAGAQGSSFGRSASAGINAVAIGRQAAASATITNQSDIAIGNNATANGFGSIAIGDGASATGLESVVIGGQSTSDGGFASIAIGRGSTATAANQFVGGSATQPSSMVSFGGGPTGTTAYTIGNAQTGISFVSSNVVAAGNGTANDGSGTYKSAQHALAVHANTSSSVTLDQSATFWPCTGTIMVQLPNATGLAGVLYVIKNNGTGTVTVSTTSSQTIDGSATLAIPAQYQVYNFVSDGSNWQVW